MDLSKYLEKHSHGLESFQIKLLLFQLLRGLDFCHKKKILHRLVRRPFFLKGPPPFIISHLFSAAPTFTFSPTFSQFSSGKRVWNYVWV